MAKPTTVRLSLGDALVEAEARLAAEWVSSRQARRVLEILGRFSRFCGCGHGLSTLAEVTPAIAAAFVRASTETGSASTSLMHLRRTSVRLLFRAARRAGAEVGDPTLDLELPPRSALRTRPLTDDEVALCRSAAQWSLEDTRHAAAWALAEATCRSSELPQVRRRDVDLENNRVCLHGGRTTRKRWAILSAWARTQLEHRLALIDAHPSTQIVYAGDDDTVAGQVSACIAIGDVLTRAGLGAERDVRPASIAAWAGGRVLAETGRIDVVARRLGMASLDRAARFIGWAWTEADDA